MIDMVMTYMAASLRATMAFLLIQPVASSLTYSITWRVVRRAGIGLEGAFLFVLPLEITGIFGREYNKMDYMDKFF